MNNLLKKVICCMLVFCLAAAFAACGKKDEPVASVDGSDVAGAAGSVLDMIAQTGKENAQAEIGDYVLVDESDFDWEETEGGAVLTAYTGTETVIELPAQVGGLDLVALGKNAFCDTPVVAVKLPDTVKSVGYQCFMYVMTLVKVELGSGMEVIDYSAFESCSALSDINLVDSIHTIDDRAFAMCSSLKTVTLPKNLEKLGSGAFCLAGGLESITIPGSVSTIESQTFTTCNALKTVTMEPGVTTIEHGAFESCKVLESVYVPESVTDISSIALKNSENATIYAAAGSYAESFAQEWEIPFEATN